MPGACLFLCPRRHWAQLVMGVELLSKLIWLPHCWVPPTDEELGSGWDNPKSSTQHSRVEREGLIHKSEILGWGWGVVRDTNRTDN